MSDASTGEDPVEEAEEPVNTDPDDPHPEAQSGG